MRDPRKLVLRRARAVAMIQRLERAIAVDGKDTPENRKKLASWQRRLKTAEAALGPAPKEERTCQSSSEQVADLDGAWGAAW